jgi:hypothetical protein
MKWLALTALVTSLAAWAGGELYSLSTEGTTSKLKAGEKGSLVIALSLADGAHVSDEAPLKISLSGGRVLLDKATLTLTDSVAKKQGDQRYAAPRFEVGFVPSAGATSIDAKLSFFVCTATQCLRQTRTLSVPLEVL